jgi:hypothetical protein
MPNRPSNHAPMTRAEPLDPHGALRSLLADIGPCDLPAEDRILQIAHGLEAQDAPFWDRLVGELDYHGLTLLVGPIIEMLARTTPGAVPDASRRTFFALASRHRQLAAVREACIDRLLTAFAAAGITMILLKGAALAHRIYPSPELRPMVDIDILIDPAQAKAAVEVASELGYTFESRHSSKYAGRSHHIPIAETVQSGFRIFLEIHINAMHLDQPFSLVLSNLTSPPQPFARGSGPAGLALGHTDMLRHLAGHTFGQGHRVRLIHLYDLWRYQAIFRNEIEWRAIETRFPQVTVALHLATQVFDSPQNPTVALTDKFEPVPSGQGFGMIPFSEIAASDMSLAGKLSAIFNPPAWWLHGFYGVPPERSLLICRTVRHPLMMARWLLARCSALIGLRGNWNWVEAHNKANRGAGME